MTFNQSQCMLLSNSQEANSFQDFSRSKFEGDMGAGVYYFFLRIKLYFVSEFCILISYGNYVKLIINIQGFYLYFMRNRLALYLNACLVCDT